eukprot:4931834-Lingulodinium_polyedra.AAC.1
MERMEWLVVVDLDDFEVVPTAPVSPLHQFLDQGRKLSGQMGIVLAQTGPAQTVRVHAARNAFWQLGVGYLAKILALEGLAEPTPKDLFGYVTTLVQHILSPTPEEFAEILSRRSEQMTSGDLPLPVEAVEGLMDEEDLKDTKAWRKSLEKHQEEAQEWNKRAVPFVAEKKAKRQ